MRSPQRENVVAIRMRRLGDVLATLDALRALKRAAPDREVTYVVDAHYHALLSGQDYIDRLLPSPPRVRGPRGVSEFVRYVRRLRSLRPGVVLDFHSNARSALVTSLSGAGTRVGYDVKLRKVAYNVVVPRAAVENGRRRVWNAAESAMMMARHAGAAPDGEPTLPEIAVGERERGRGAELLVSAGVPPEAVAAGAVAGVNPGRYWPTKSWPESYFAELCRRLAARGRPVVVLWGPGEEDAAARIAAGAGRGVRVGPRATVAELPGVLKHLAYLVTIDSGLKHLAVCARVPTVTILGSTTPREWHMGTDRDGYLWRDYACSPCRLRVCPLGTPCLRDIRPGDVMDELRRLGLEVEEESE